mgnify:CR=1 FL=1
MQNYIFQNNKNIKRIKYCVYKENEYGKYALIAMTMNLNRVEALINFKFSVNLEDIICKVGDYYLQDGYLVKAEYFKY